MHQKDQRRLRINHITMIPFPQKCIRPELIRPCRACFYIRVVGSNNDIPVEEIDDVEQSNKDIHKILDFYEPWNFSPYI